MTQAAQTEDAFVRAISFRFNEIVRVRIMQRRISDHCVLAGLVLLRSAKTARRRQRRRVARRITERLHRSHPHVAAPRPSTHNTDLARIQAALGDCKLPPPLVHFSVARVPHQGRNYRPADRAMRGVKGQEGPLPLGKRNVSTIL